MYPKPQAKRPAPAVQKPLPKKGPVVKKQKKNWWEQQ